MKSLTDYDITEAMVCYGGSFVRGLGQLFRIGDDENRTRLKATFPEYWATYRELAELKASKAEHQRQKAEARS